MIASGTSAVRLCVCILCKYEPYIILSYFTIHLVCSMSACVCYSARFRLH